MHADVVEGFELFWRNIAKTAAIEMVPAGASALAFIGTLDPGDFFFLVFAADTEALFGVVVLVVVFWDRLGFLFFLLCELGDFLNFLTLNVFEHDSL